MPVEGNENRPSSEIVLSHDQVLREVREIVGEHTGVPPEDIQESDALEANLRCDSLDVVEIAMEVEEQFAIDLPEEGAVTRAVFEAVGEKDPGRRRSKWCGQIGHRLDAEIQLGLVDIKTYCSRTA